MKTLCKVPAVKSSKVLFGELVEKVYLAGKITDSPGEAWRSLWNPPSNSNVVASSTLVEKDRADPEEPSR